MALLVLVLVYGYMAGYGYRWNDVRRVDRVGDGVFASLDGFPSHLSKSDSYGTNAEGAEPALIALSASYNRAGRSSTFFRPLLTCSDSSASLLNDDIELKRP